MAFSFPDTSRIRYRGNTLSSSVSTGTILFKDFHVDPLSLLAVVVFCIGVIVQTTAFQPSSIYGGLFPFHFKFCEEAAALRHMVQSARPFCYGNGCGRFECRSALVQVSHRPDTLLETPTLILASSIVPNLRHLRSEVVWSHSSNSQSPLESWCHSGSTTGPTSLGVQTVRIRVKLLGDFPLLCN